MKAVIALAVIEQPEAFNECVSLTKTEWLKSLDLPAELAAG